MKNNINNLIVNFIIVAYIRPKYLFFKYFLNIFYYCIYILFNIEKLNLIIIFYLTVITLIYFYIIFIF